MMGVKSVFQSGAKPAKNDDAIIMIRKLGFVMQHAATQLQNEGLFAEIDLSKSNACMQSIESAQITDDIMTFINSAFDAYSVG